jgi:hypothetical protein
MKTYLPIAFVLLAGCAAIPEQPKIVARAPPPEVIRFDIPVRCVNKKPEIPKTALTTTILAAAEEAVTALEKPPPEIAKEQLSAWIKAIDVASAALLVDFNRMKGYIADADPLLIACMVEPTPEVKK